MEKQTENEPVSKKRRHLIPKEYIFSVADRIHSINPSKDILNNTLKDMWKDGFVKGYLSRIEDNKYFNDKRNKRCKDSFDSIRTEFEDEIFGGKIEVKPKQ